jgi:TNF receptor-associated factor 2/TNF receptor-associated factor 3
MWVIVMDRKWMQLLGFLSVSDQTHRKHVVQTFKPTPESSSFHQPSSDMNVASGCPQFAKLTIFDEDCYVNNDVMFIKCIVDTTKIFHP